MGVRCSFELCNIANTFYEHAIREVLAGRAKYSLIHIDADNLPGLRKG